MDTDTDVDIDVAQDKDEVMPLSLFLSVLLSLLPSLPSSP